MSRATAAGALKQSDNRQKRRSLIPSAAFDHARTVHAGGNQRDRSRTSDRVNDGQRCLSEDVRMTSQLQ